MRMRTDIVGAYLSPRIEIVTPRLTLFIANLRDVAMDLETERTSTNARSASGGQIDLENEFATAISRPNSQHRC